MINVFSGVKSLLKCKKLHIDHCVFRLHYKISVVLLLGFCALVGSKQYAGEPIKCSSDTADFSSLVESYCFITATYTVRRPLNKTPTDAPHPGIYHSQDSKEYHYHVYYQWIGFLLFLQAILFYLPHWLWKSMEGGDLVRLLGKEPKDSSLEERDKYKNLIVEYLRSRWCRDGLYTIKYFFCEFLCLFNVVGQLFLLDDMFDGDYFYFGIDVVNYFLYKLPTAVNPLEKVFPRVTSCTYRYFGEGGRIRKTSVLCVLAINAINEKIFLFLWFWIVSLSILTAFALIYKLIIFSFEPLRIALLRINFANVHAEHFRLIVENGDIGNYLFIYLLGQNMDQLSFNDVIIELVSRFQKR